MIKLNLHYSIWIFICLAEFLLPSARASARTVDCDHLTSVQEVLSCALRDHPDARAAQASVEQGRSLESVAGQIPNPELSSQAVFGNTEVSESFSYLEFNLTQPIELGGKRGSRIAKAQAELEQRQAAALGVRERIYISTLLALYRIRQLQAEQAVLKGALNSFSSIERQYRSRPRLNPEQTASLRIFEIADGDYRLRLAPLEAELNHELHTLEHALGRPFDAKPGLLPQKKRNWPKLFDSELSRPVLGSQVQEAISGLKFAQTQLELARSDSWPDLKLGPTYETQSQGLASYNALGVNLTLFLPVFNTNGPGREYARLGISRSELALQATKIEGGHEREYYLKRYQGAVAALESSLSSREIEKRHDEVERLFDRGLLPGTLVIETHRQILDFTRDQNEQELAAIESLAKFYAYQGRLFQEQL